MVTAHNITAMNAQRQYKVVGLDKKKSTEKLSSGYRINRAADDAAGLSISEKMRKQIRGLDQGQENIQDGISYLQIGDGAMEEVSSMLLRMEELAVQGANGTNSESDRLAINDEVRQLKKEINRVSRTTKFNEKNVFDNSEIMALDVQGILVDMNFFNASYDKVTGEVVFGGFVFHDRRISWDSIDPDMVYVDDQGVQRFHSGSYTYQDGEGNVLNFSCEEGTKVPEITRKIKIEADAFGIRIDERPYSWDLLRDEDGLASENGWFHEGTWSLDYEGAKVNFVLLEEVDTYKGMEDEINKLQTGKARYQLTECVKDYISEQAVDINPEGSTIQINAATAAMYADPAQNALKIHADEDGIWLQKVKTEYYIKDPSDPTKETIISDPDTYAGTAPLLNREVWEDVGTGKVDSLQTWAQMGILDWSNGKSAQSDITYRYQDTDGVNDTSYSFTYNLSDVTSLDSVKDGLDGVIVRFSDAVTNYQNTANQTNLKAADVTSRLLSMRAECHGSPTCVQEYILGRDFEQKQTDVCTENAKKSTGNSAKIDFKSGSDSVLTYSGSLIPTENKIISDVGNYVNSLVRRMSDLALSGVTDPQSVIKGQQGKALTDVVGAGNVTATGYFSENITITGGMKKTSNLDIGKQYASASIDFSSVSDLNDLWGIGFDSTCKTCSNHYSILFGVCDSSASSTSNGYRYKMERDGQNYQLTIDLLSLLDRGVQPSGLTNAIVDIADAALDFHFTQYATDGSKLYILDNRSQIGGAPNAKFWANPYQNLTEGRCSVSYSDGQGGTVDTQYTYDFEDILDQVHVQMKEWAGTADGERYVKLANPYKGKKYVLASDYDKPGSDQVYGSKEVGAETKFFSTEVIYQTAGKSRDDLLSEYAGKITDEIVKGFQLTLHAADYTKANTVAEEFPNEAIRTIFDVAVQKSIDSVWGPRIQCSGQVKDQLYISKFPLDVYTLGLSGVNVKTEEDATQMIDMVGAAQRYVSAKRSLFGALQNRMEHTYAVRSQMEEDTTAAESRIRDTDMATEMVNLSKQNILASFGEAMMAQTRQNSQSVLSLLS